MYKKLEKNLIINGRAQNTLSNYGRCLAHLAMYYNKSPELLSKESIDDYLFHCKNLENTPSDSYFKHTVYALRAIYRILGMDERKAQLPKMKRGKSLPEVLSIQEVKRFISAPKLLKHRLMIAMLYGCGLRSYELCALKISDIDFDRKTVFVKRQKGNRDRYVPLSVHLVRGLKRYIESENPHVHLFNSQRKKEGKPLPISVRSIQWVIQTNRNKIGTSKHVTAHTLRHTYATHLLESGLNLIALKELLGHATIETTLVYLHVSNSGTSKKYSPLDLLYNK